MRRSITPTRPRASTALTGHDPDQGYAGSVGRVLEEPAVVAHVGAEHGLALGADGAPPLKTLKVDGGVTANSFAMQFVADICEVVPTDLKGETD